MPTFLAFALLVLIHAPNVAAQQGIVDECEIESFEHQEQGGRLLISGTASCSEARIEMSVFNEATNERLGSAFTYVMNGEFELYLSAPAPEAIVIDYRIE